eukprot:2551851-Pyramimonas_sp.AAC.1
MHREKSCIESLGGFSFPQMRHFKWRPAARALKCSLGRASDADGEIQHPPARQVVDLAASGLLQ